MKDSPGPGRRRLRRWRTLGLVLGVAGAVGVWRLREPDGTHPPPSPRSPPFAARPAPSANAGVRSAAAEAPGLAGSAFPMTGLAAPSGLAAPPSAAGGLSAEQLALIEKHWCTQGLKAHQQARQAQDRTPALRGDAAAQEHEAQRARGAASSRETGSQAMLAVESRLKRHWIQQLRQRADMRSQAAADYLQITMREGDEARTLIPHLLGLAQSSRDPMIFMLWQLTLRGCPEAAPCRALPMSDWRSLDPRNLLAWLSTRPEGQNTADLDWPALAATSFASSHLEELQDLLLPMLEQEAPGLALQQGLSLINRLSHEWPGRAGALALSPGCLDATDSPAQRAAICLHAADLLWRSPSASVFDAKFAVAVAELAGATAQAPWAERRAFIKGLSAMDGQRLMDLEYPANRDGQGCEALIEQRRQLNERVRHGLWSAALGGERRGRPP